MDLCIILTLTSNLNEAKKIAHALVKSKLAACVNIIQNVISVYEWKNEICEDGEYFIFIKTQKAHFEGVKEEILKNHSYELPVVLMLPVETGLLEYLEWVKKNTTPAKHK
jgi:periplasmic divalent cation tolerance protein